MLLPTKLWVPSTSMSYTCSRPTWLISAISSHNTPSPSSRDSGTAIFIPGLSCETFVHLAVPLPILPAVELLSLLDFWDRLPEGNATSALGRSVKVFGCDCG